MSTRSSTPDILGEILNDDVSRETRGALVWVAVGRIYDNPYQPRLAYDDEQTRLLADNIWSLREELPATLGMQQPPVARAIRFVAGDAQTLEREAYSDGNGLRRRLLSDGHAVQLHFGHRRLRAWRLLRERDADGYAEFPVFVAYANDEAMWRHAVTENAQRKDISPLEEAMSLRQAIGQFKLTQEQAGAPFGYARATVANKLRLLDLPENLRAALADGRISERHGRELLRLAPAPHLYAGYMPDRVATLSTRELELEISKTIGRGQPIPKNGRTGYARLACWDGGQMTNETYEPPAWPLDWAPAAKVERIVGACIGCRFYACFGGDAGARCTEVLGTCFEAKQKRWQVEQAEKQQAALEASRKPEPAIPPAAPTITPTIAAEVIPAQSPAGEEQGLIDWTDEDWAKEKDWTNEGWAQAKAAEQPQADAPAGGGKLLVDWTEEDWAEAYEEQRKAAAASPVAAAAPSDNNRLSADGKAAPDAGAESAVQPIAGVTITTDLSNLDVTWFSTRGWNTAPAALLSKGLCNAERCKCLVLAYKRDPDSEDVRPDPEHAPNMCYGCTSKQRLANRQLEMEHGDVQEMRKRVKTEQQEAERLLAEAFSGYRADELWHNRTFALGLIKSHVTSSYQADDWDLATMQEKLFMAVAAGACKRWDNNKEIWMLERVQTWLQELAVGAGRHVEQLLAAPIVEEPAEEWTEADEATYQNLVMDWDGATPRTLVALVEGMFLKDSPDLTPAVLRRLAEAVTDINAKTYFGQLATNIKEMMEESDA